MPSALFSLQTKLILAFALVVMIALVLAGSAFIALRRGEEEEKALDHVIASSPPIYTEFSFLQRAGNTSETLVEFVGVAAERQDVRILLVERATGVVTEDTGGALTGEQLVLPQDFDLARASRLQPYVSWHPPEDSPGQGLILVTALPSDLREFRQVPPRGAEPHWILFAVTEESIAGAWRDLLPALLISSLIALPIAAAVAALVAAYLSRPLQKLTAASRRVAEGTYDVDVAIDRSDEVGRLARSFSIMAQRVGETHTQMRTLVANVSHDLKTPLTSILGFAQALRDGSAKDEAQAQRVGQVIHEEASRLSTRLNDLLYLAELESGQSIVQRDEIDLHRLLERTVERITSDLKQRDIALQTKLADVTVSADGPKLERAFENLLDNARKYTPGRGEVVVNLTPNGHGAAIDIANTAPDIAPEELPRIFERFYRGDRTRSHARSGSGLGLAIARDLIELHGGTIGASLDEGKLIVSVRLPRVPGTHP
jgi:signal transduction histidine kinase